MTQPTRIDPIQNKYYRPIEKAEKWSGWIFAASAFLSIATAVIPEKDYRQAFGVVQLGFLASVLALFLLDLTIRLYLSPRGADARALDFFARAYGQPLTHERTSEYYNSPTGIPALSIGAQTFENTFFTKAVVNKMWQASIPFAVFYVLVWFCAVLYRETSLPLLATCAQVIFGEQIISKFFRLLWLQWRSEQVFNDLTNIFTAGVNNPTFNARVMVVYTKYESSKSVAGITLSSRIFKKMNPELTVSWEQLKRTYGI